MKIPQILNLRKSEKSNDGSNEDDLTTRAAAVQVNMELFVLEASRITYNYARL